MCGAIILSGSATALSYLPLTVEGPKHAHLIAFCRGERVAVVAPRWSVRLGSGFGSTTVDVPPGRWTNVLCGDKVSEGKNRAQHLLKRFPVALLVRDTGVSDVSI